MSGIEPIDVADFLDSLCTASLRPESHESAKTLASLYKMTAAEIRRLREERMTTKLTPEELAAVREAGENWRLHSYTHYRDLGVTLRALADRMEGGK